jgi:hypothetical protein
MTTYTRRKLLAAAATVAVAGCVTEGQQSPTEDNQMNDTNDSDTENTEQSSTNMVAEREAELERLPDRSPLSTGLADLFAAPDREAYAESNDAIPYRDGHVRVEITLEPGGEAPEQYLPAETSGYGETVIADVLIDDLVDLALEDDVRLVSLPSQPQTH